MAAEGQLTQANLGSRIGYIRIGMEYIYMQDNNFTGMLTPAALQGLVSHRFVFNDITEGFRLTTVPASHLQLDMAQRPRGINFLRWSAPPFTKRP